MRSEPSLQRLHPNSFAYLALPTSVEVIRKLNAEARSVIDNWVEDEWVIGEDGAGNYFVVSQSGEPGVREFDHEWSRFDAFQPSLRAYFEYVLGIAKNAADSDR